MVSAACIAVCLLLCVLCRLARVSALGLSQRTFSHARQVLAAPTPAAAPKPAAPAAAPAASSSSVALASPTSFGEIVERYGGWYPFLGLAGVIAVSKEALILNEELLLVSNFAAMFATLYLVLGDQVTKAAEEARAEIVKRQDELSDFEIEQQSAVLQAHELNIEQVSVLQKLKAEHNSLSASLLTAKGLKVRHAARDAVVKKLGDIKSREQSERASFREAIAVRASAYVKRQFAASPAATKNALVEFAIDVVEGKATALDAKADPVKKLYTDYFNQQLYVKEIEQEKQQQKSKQ